MRLNNYLGIWYNVYKLKKTIFEIAYGGTAESRFANVYRQNTILYYTVISYTLLYKIRCGTQIFVRIRLV